jgi:hypothetical protein
MPMHNRFPGYLNKKLDESAISKVFICCQFAHQWIAGKHAGNSQSIRVIDHPQIRSWIQPGS